MPDLHLIHTLLITQQEIYLALGTVIAAALLALLSLCFIRRWTGILIGFLVLVALVGGGLYTYQHVKAGLQTASIEQQNESSLITSAKKDYGVTLSTKQANGLLVGTSGYSPSKVTAGFGDIQNVSVPSSDQVNHLEDVQLIYLKNQWRLITHPGNGVYQELSHV